MANSTARTLLSLATLLVLLIFGLISHKVVAEEGTAETPGEEPGDSAPFKEDSASGDAKVEIFASVFPVYQDGAANRTLYGECPRPDHV
jgi:hypothetical protein